MKNLAVLISLLLMSTILSAQEVMNLYPEKIPNSKINNEYVEKSDTSKYRAINVTRIATPQLIAYYPENPNGTAIIICPGGGYSLLSITNGGTSVAEALNKQGITAFVLKYRLPSNEIMIDKTIGPLQDAQQAIKTVRENAEKWHINPNLIGIMGFSAGGHLASTLETHYQKSLIDNPKNTNLRPDFAVLGYPVVTMGALTHKGSHDRLLGLNPTEEQVKLYSNELQVTKETPPTFIFHAIDDETVPVENSINLLVALKNKGVKCEMHLYQAGGHGYGLKNKTTEDKWFDRMMNWLKGNQFVN